MPLSSSTCGARDRALYKGYAPPAPLWAPVCFVLFLEIKGEENTSSYWVWFMWLMLGLPICRTNDPLVGMGTQETSVPTSKVPITALCEQSADLNCRQLTVISKCALGGWHNEILLTDEMNSQTTQRDMAMKTPQKSSITLWVGLTKGGLLRMF